MNNSILNDLLKEYEKNRLNNIYDAENRKKKIYLSNPRLQEIDDSLAKESIETAKMILKNNSKDNLINLKKGIEKLKIEKQKILENLNLPLNYLDPKFDCPICKDTGYIFENRKNFFMQLFKTKNIQYRVQSKK